MRRTLSMFTLAALLLVPACLFAVPAAEQGKPAASKIQSLHDLPPGAAPAVVKAMLKDLPEEYQLQENSQALTMANPAWFSAWGFIAFT
eukprot:CAMPEP_0201285874 /NCGR_PEP_ID=MMETSP1317-20130820/113953_1 /ASSEMBLY_ACC=CAM_ASM_000770 /TAXON_ID=187299 /ORGANISM="Undescribed Undescribed, Strain Undescribed" /LENGTH=88 /DNA_ID=CAMNT_0047612003 /DNA_START=2489 /DNA_END=2755 /DNA_ORIENTATION=+